MAESWDKALASWECKGEEELMRWTRRIEEWCDEQEWVRRISMMTGVDPKSLVEAVESGIAIEEVRERCESGRMGDRLEFHANLQMLREFARENNIEVEDDSMSFEVLRKWVPRALRIVPNQSWKERMSWLEGVYVTRVKFEELSAKRAR